MKLTETKTKNVNNQRVFKEIDDFMMEVFGTLDIHWSNESHHDQLIEMLDMWMEQYALETGKIIQYDMRINSVSDTHVLTLTYRQRNCFNTTIIEYYFEK